MARQSFSRIAFHQDLYAADTGNIGGQSLYQRIDGELLAQNVRAMLIGESAVDVNDSRARIDQENAANIGSRRQRVRLVRLLVNAEESAQQFFAALLATA